MTPPPNDDTQPITLRLGSTACLHQVATAADWLTMPKLLALLEEAQHALAAAVEVCIGCKFFCIMQSWRVW